MENIEGILIGIFAGIVLIIFILGAISSLTMLNNEIEEVMVDCYDRESNVINEVTCTEELYHCNKFERFFNPESCFKEEVE